MTDLDDQERDDPDSPTDYATVEEVANELALLSSDALDKIESQARILVRGTGMDARELINTVVVRLLMGGCNGRHWHRKETLAGCIYRTMKSVIRDHWRRLQFPMTAISDGAAGLREEPDPETQLIARQELHSVLSTLGDENDTSAIALALASGHSPAEIRQKFGLTETEYDSALKRIRRKILKHKASGDQS